MTAEPTCDVCGRRRSWGCGHTPAQERAARRHRQTLKHREGRCNCYVDRPGYFAPPRPTGAP